jgi:hypothetical protein
MRKNFSEGLVLNVHEPHDGQRPEPMQRSRCGATNLKTTMGGCGRFPFRAQRQDGADVRDDRATLFAVIPTETTAKPSNMAHARFAVANRRRKDIRSLDFGFANGVPSAASVLTSRKTISRCRAMTTLMFPNALTSGLRIM